MATRPALLLALVVLASCAGRPSQAIPDIRAKCSACQCISMELRHRMEDEKPRNHLDMRHRLDQTGKRYGKVIDYKISELRAVELLDGICDQMKNYIHATFTISPSGKTTQQWAKWMGKESSAMVNSTRFEHHEEQALGKLLQIYCGAVMEDFEEDLEGAITSGKFENLDAIDDYLCKEKVKACPDGTVPRTWIDEPPPPTPEEAVSADGTDSGAAAAQPVDAAPEATMREESAGAAGSAAGQDANQEL